ncbi:MAG TPA: hypothetical protein PK400_06480 [Phycisphaerales bacterium]|nr:hypothetical protein [Phycisphaerales bacterium]HRQ75761.1 hypothetical protein [Phycisphaerales bacterium]
MTEGRAIPPSIRPARPWTRRIIMPLVVLAVAAGILYFARQREAQHLAEVEHAVRLMLQEIAGERTVASPPLTVQRHAGQSLIEQIEESLVDRRPGSPGFGVLVMAGDDDPPFGDASATHLAWVTLPSGGRLVLRLKHPGDHDAIRILGHRVDGPVP